ncbi:hypothetical protein Pmani_008225 [Petrolisthes manimaculis]|uniref:Uncharacterized protein n=1 Tax=Petrolisthes manimaculis TaxID=1843537 RepID=A0AAE1UEV3_9EUCA|nr:hypothetical protein Pmani_008225 [Petrolisthes manimaculis]
MSTLLTNMAQAHPGDTEESSPSTPGQSLNIRPTYNATVHNPKHLTFIGKENFLKVKSNHKDMECQI